MGVLNAMETRDGAPGEARHERLGKARAEFVAHLGRRSAELRAALVQVASDPSSIDLRDALRRRVRALGIASRALHFARLAERMDEAGAVLEAPRGGVLSGPEISVLHGILEQLPALVWGQTAIQANGGAASQPAPAAPSPAAPQQAPLTVLVVGGAPLAEALSDDRRPGASVNQPFEVERTEDTTTAIDLARALAPDVAVLDVDLPGARALVEAWVADPLTEQLPILAIGGFLRAEDAAPFVALGVARALTRPVSPDALRRAATEAAATYVRGEVTRAPLGEVRLDQLGARLAEELQRGLCDAAGVRARGSVVDMGEGAEVLAALWGAVARIRDVVTIRSQGTIRFSPSGPEGAMPLAPWLGPPEPVEASRTRERANGRRGASMKEGAEEVSLEGLGVVVADDDPAVTWFLAGVLRAAGAAVHEAHDGARALEIAHRVTPDLVVSDVLMPRLDGFALCRALKRDVVLRDVPVILLSWKEDLLQRLRELGADADGYLRKEASAAAIVRRVHEVMRPRRRVAERIAAGGDVRGRLDGLTTRTLLSLACACRPASIVSVRDAAFLYEVPIREGRPVGATRTAPDGTFQRGPSVLAALLGVGSGRFVVASMPADETDAPPRSGFEGTLAEQLLPAIAAARAAQRLLGGSSLIHIDQVMIDEERMSVYAAVTPEETRSLLKRLMRGAAPRSLITSGQVAARMIEDVLCDAAARGCVMGVFDRRGDDLLAPAVAEEMEVLRGVKRTPPPAPPLPPGLSAPSRVDAALEGVEDSGEVSPALEAVVIDAAAAAPEPEAPAAVSVPVVDVPRSGPNMALGSLTPPPVTEGAAPIEVAPVEVAPVEVAPAGSAICQGGSAPSSSVADRGEWGPDGLCPAGRGGASPLAGNESPAPRKVKRPSAYAPSPRPPPRESRAMMWVLLAVAAFVFAVGARLSRERDLRAQVSMAAVAAPPPPPDTAEPAPPPPEPLGPIGESPANPMLPEDLPLPAGTTVPDGQGLMEIIAGPSDAVTVDGRPVGTGTVRVSLAPKPDPFEVRVTLRGEERIRYARVSPGRLTRMRVSPPWRR